jgi:hypothetical protein
MRGLLMVILAANVLFHFDPPEVLIFVDPSVRVEDPVAFAAEQACPSLLAEKIPLPVPFHLQWFKPQGEGRGEIPDPSHRVTGMVTECAVRAAGR